MFTLANAEVGCSALCGVRCPPYSQLLCLSKCVRDGVAPIRKIYLLGLWGVGVAPPLRELPASGKKSRPRTLAAN